MWDKVIASHPGWYRVCLCASISCGTRDFSIDAGVFFAPGKPIPLLKPIDAIARKPFDIVLDVQESLSNDNRVRVVESGIECGALGADIVDASLIKVDTFPADSPGSKLPGQPGRAPNAK